MEKVEHGFSRMVFSDIETFPIEILLGNAEEVLENLQKIVEETKKEYKEYSEFWFVPDGVDIKTSAHKMSRRGSVPDNIIETSRAAVLAELMRSKQALPENKYSNYMATFKLIGFREQTVEEMKERPQSKEEREALEQRERALLKRLKDKYECDNS